MVIDDLSVPARVIDVFSMVEMVIDGLWVVQVRVIDVFLMVEMAIDDLWVVLV
jgi:hypothetical protein